jgi:hypothetical protein
MNLPSVTVITLEIDGRKHTFAAPIGDRDPMEVTLGEWMACPLLSADAMVDQLFREHRDARQSNGDQP